MAVQTTRYLLISLLALSIKAEDINSNVSLSEELRQPRTSGRIVKLYSGTKPEPILCAGEGFQADSKDCAIFYRCIKSSNGKYSVFKFQCGPGTVYDPHTEVCNHPRNTQRSECGGLKEPSSDTSYNHVSEIEEEQQEFPSPISTKLPIYTERTTATASFVAMQSSSEQISFANYNPSGPSTKRQEQNVISSSTIYPITTNHLASFSVVTPSPVVLPVTKQLSSNNNICTFDGFIGDSDNCHKFYRCVRDHKGGYMKYEFSCSESTIWDDDVQACNHPWAVKRSRCGRNSVYNKNSSIPNAIDIAQETTSQTNPVTHVVTNKTIQQQVQISDGSKVSQNQIQISKGPAVQNQTQINYGDKVDKRKYSSVNQNQTQISHNSAISQVQTQINNENEEVQTQLQIDHLYEISQTQIQIQESSIKNTSINNDSNGCTESGFMSDPNDCKKFYRCVNNGRGSYTRHEFSCGEGTVWDSEMEACNHAWLVKECGRKVSSYPVTHEVLSTSSIKSTPSYDIMTTKTSHNYYTTSAITPTKAFEDVGYGIGSQDTTVSATITMNTTTPDMIESEENECKSSGFFGDTKDCKIFYRCVENDKGGYTKHEFKCGEGTVWDPEIESCNHAWAVKKCGRGAPIESEKIEHATTSGTSTTTLTSVYMTQSDTQLIEQTVQHDDYDSGYGSHKEELLSTTIKTTKQPQFQNENETKECESSGFMSDKQNCKKFYRCVNSGNGSYTRYEFICGEGTVWDTELESCNYEWAVKECGSKNISTSDFITSTVKSTQHDYSTSTKTTIYYNITSETVLNTNISHSTALETTTTHISQMQENECKTSGFMGDTKDCKIFYRCVENGERGFTKYEFKCGDGTIWDPDIEACNHVWAVKKCGGIASINNETIESTTTSKHTTNTNSQTGQQIVLNDDYDTGYNSNGDTLSSTTTKAPKEPQVQDHYVTNECQSSGFMGDMHDCKKFYRCVDTSDGSYTRYEFTCGDSTVWDPKIQACNHVWAVEDCGVSSPASTSDETSHHNATTVHEEIGVSYSTQSESNPDTTTMNSLTSTTTVKIIISSDENKCSSSGFVGDSKDCKKFYRCVDNGDGSYTRYEFMCGEGTIWDQNIEACNHPWTVEKCGNISETIEHATTSPTSTIINDEEIASGYPQQDEEIVGQTTQNSTNSSTTEISNALNKYNCKTIGFFGDKTNCKTFYRCVDDGKGGFIQHEFQCGEGTVWDHSIEACNHAWVVKTCGSGNYITVNQTESTTLSDSTLFTEKTTTSSENYPVNESTANCKQAGFFGVNNDCKKFYRCVDNGEGGLIKHDFKCGEGTYWNQNITACDHASPNQSCSQNESTTKEPEPEHDEMFTSTTTKSTALLVTVDSQETSSIQTSQVICESEGFFSEFNDCNKFYRCVDNGNGIYTKYEFTCGDGTVWNQEIQACDHKSSDNKCIPVNSSSEINGSQQDNKENNTTAITTITQEQQSTEKSDTVTSSSNNRCESEGFHADSSDCKKFIRCVSNTNGGYTKYEFTCGEGTIWFQDIQACDHDDGAKNCSSQYNYTIKPQTTESQQIFTTSEIISSTSTSQPQTPAKEDDEYESENSKEPELTSEDCSSEGFYADPNDCKRFYRCVDNNLGGYIKYDFSCGEGTAWDGDIQACNLISQVRTCNNNSVTQDSQIQPIMHDEEISQTTENISTTKSTSSSNENTSSQDACEKEGYYGNTKNCKLFYRCVDDGNSGFTKYDYSCGDGTIWDQDITACNHPQDVVNASCNQEQVDSSTSSISSTTPSITSSTSNSAISQSTISTTESSGQTSQNCTQEESSNKPVNKNITCDKAGYYPDPNDCKKFYRCVDWDGDGKRFSVYYFDCGEGTIWDPAVETCNHEESVYPPRDCSGAQSQNENMESTTTSDKITTIQSTTSDETADQQPTTQQTTTAQSTISEQTTAQQSTTTETSTTQQSSTSDQTTQESSTTTQSTTQQSISTEKSTTQQPSTIEQTTTQQPTSSEHTTQQSSTSEQTTSQTSTASEETSVKPSTSSEQTTTEQTTQSTDSNGGTTTEEPITTESSTVSEGTSTEPYTTNQQTTTDHASTTDSSNTTASTATTTQSSDTSSTTENQQETTTNETSNQECPDTDDDQNLFACPTSFRRHPKYCNVFYQCTEDDDSHGAKIAVFNCPNNTIYDESKIQCVEEDKADKPCKGEIAATRRFKRVGENFKEPIVVTRDSQMCPGVGHMAFEKNSECSPAFLKCEKTNTGKLRGFVHQCPEGYTYWSISRRCERNDNVINCKRTSNNWNNRWEIPVERNNVAW